MPYQNAFQWIIGLIPKPFSSFVHFISTQGEKLSRSLTEPVNSIRNGKEKFALPLAPHFLLFTPGHYTN